MSMSHITIPNVSPRIVYVGDGVQTVFGFPFPIFQDADLAVSLNDASQVSGFRITGSGGSTGGMVTFDVPPLNGMTVTLERRMPLHRVTDFVESGRFAARAINNELDYLTAALQQVSGDQQPMLRFPRTDGIIPTVLPNRSARAGKLLGFDGDGLATLFDPGDSQAPPAYLPPGGGAVMRSIGDKLNETVSVKDYGAIGDGIADDTVPIQSALAQGASVFVPAGRYRVTATLSLGYGQRLFGAGQASVLAATGTMADLIELPDSYAQIDHLRLENGQAGIRLYGRDGPCVQNAISDVTIWDARYGIVLDGFTDTNKPCYWNNFDRVLVVRPLEHGVWLTRTGAGDTPNANRFHQLRVYSLAAPTSGIGINVEQGRFNNAFTDCEVNLSTTAQHCVRVGANTDKTLFVNLYTETLAAIDNILIEEGSIETAIINLLSASAGPAINDQSGGEYTAVNAGYPEKNRLGKTRVSDLTVEQLRFDTEFFEESGPATLTIDLKSSCYLVSAFNGDVTVDLPLAGDANGAVVTIKKTDQTANTVLVTEPGGSGPDGTSVSLGNRYDFVTVASNGAAWWIVSGNRSRTNVSYYEGGGVLEPELEQDVYLISAWVGATECRLPVPSASHAVGRTVVVKKNDPSGNPVSVTQQGGGGPDNATVTLTNQYDAVTCLSNGAAWHVLSRNP